MSDQFNDEEDYLRLQLRQLQEAYNREAEPIIKRLTEIHIMKRPVITLSREDIKCYFREMPADAKQSIAEAAGMVGPSHGNNE